MADNAGNPEEDQQFIEYVVKSLVDQPDQVKTERTIDEMGVLITLSVAPEDLGQVIGRQGQTAKALRTLLRVVGAKHHARVNLKIYEPEGHRKNKGQGRDMRSESPAPTEDVDTSTVDDLKI